MKISNAKWLLFILPLVFGGCKAAHTEITIPADPEIIWSVLTDASGYKAWNPVLVPIEGDLREGEKLKYQMTQPDGKQSDIMARVKKMVELKELNQGGGIPGILTFDHKWLLEPVNEGTRVTQHEEYRGIGVLFWDASWVGPAYRNVNEALKNRVAHLKKNEQQ
ncbi:MAG: SRPBCC domain-containing protein [Desulfobacterales bacterium]|jgi:hypothetical protein